MKLTKTPGQTRVTEPTLTQTRVRENLQRPGENNRQGRQQENSDRRCDEGTSVCNVSQVYQGNLQEAVRERECLYNKGPIVTQGGMKSIV